MKRINKEYTLISPNCVNSKWTAKWLSKNGEYCQCPFGCKVMVRFGKEGYSNHDFVITEEEYKRLNTTEGDKK